MKRTHSSHAAAHAGAESCIALIDARFLAWLQGQTDTAQDQVRPQLHQLLSNAMAHNGLELNLRRIYWYSDSTDDQAIGGQVSRAVLPHSQDGGLSMLRTLGADLKRLAERGACDHLLVGSDDERLISLIDEAQLHGVSVHLLADEASRNMTQLNREDPGWARLLSQADQRVVLGAQAARDGGARHASSMHAVPQVDPEQLREQLKGISDVERITARIALRQVRPRELAGLRQTLASLDALSMSEQICTGRTLLSHIQQGLRN